MKFSSCFLLPLYTCFAGSPASTSAFKPPDTFDEVLSALHKLGYEYARSFPEQTSLSYAGGFNDSTNGSTKGQCLNTVGSLPCLCCSRFECLLLSIEDIANVRSIKCGILAYLLGDLVSSPGSKLYIQQQSAYWSGQQAGTLPACRVQPTDKEGVAAALIVTSFLKCPFAVKSGGHGAFAGASNIQGGLTIDLGSIKTIKVSSDRATTQVGAGNRWVDIYSALAPRNLAVIGGRVANIGVGGLTLGGQYFYLFMFFWKAKPQHLIGGISFFPGRHGFACDGVKNYEASNIISFLNLSAS